MSASLAVGIALFIAWTILPLACIAFGAADVVEMSPEADRLVELGALPEAIR